MKSVDKGGKYLIAAFLICLSGGFFHSRDAICQTNFCASSGDSQEYEWVYSMQLSTNSSYTDGTVFDLGSTYKTGYYDWTGQLENTLAAGSTVYYRIYINTNNQSWLENVYFWLDKNQDGSLVDPGERVHTTSITALNVTALTGSFVMPAPAEIGSGTVFGRIIMRYSSAPPLCGSYDYGTTFDFRIDVTGGTLNNIQSTITVNVTGSGTVTSDPAGINTSTTQTTNFSPNKLISLTGTGGSGQQFSYWTGTGITGQSTSNPLTFTTASSNETRSYTAVFVTSCVSASTPASPAGTATGQTGANLSWAASTGTATITYYWNVKRASDGVSAASGNTTGTSATTSALAANTAYYLEVYANNCGGNSGTATSSNFSTYPANPTGITASDNPVCNSAPTTLTATGAQGTVYWYTGSCGGTQVTTGNPITVSPTTTTTYYARNYNNAQFSSGCASTSVTVEQPASAGTLAKTPDVANVCQGTSVSAALTAGSGGNGSDETQYRTYAGTWSAWETYVSGTNISTTGKTAVEIQTRRLAAYCSSSTYTTVSWTAVATPNSGTLSKTPDVLNVCAGTSVSATAAAGTGGTGTIADVLQYNYDGGTWNTYTSGTSLPTANHTSVSIQTYRTASGTGCTTSTPNVATWSLNAVTVIGSQSTATQTRCIGFPFAAISVTATGTGTLSYQWYKNGSASTSGGTEIGTNSNSYTPLSTESGTLYYYCVVTGTCGSATSAVSGAFIVNPPSFVANVHHVSDLTATGENIKWYDAATNGNLLSGTDVIPSGTHDYYASQTVNGIESIDRFHVSVVVDDTPCAPAAASPQTLASGATVGDLTTLAGQNIRWYLVASGGTALSASTALSSGTYYASQTISCTESAQRVAVVVTITP